MPYDDHDRPGPSDRPQVSAVSDRPATGRAGMDLDAKPRRPAREQPVPDQPVPDQPGADQPGADRPGADQPASQRPTGDAAETDAKDAKQPAAPPKRRRLIWIILAVVALAAIIGGVSYWFATRDLESTDDAYTDGRAIMIASKVSGYVTQLAVNDNQHVKAGDVLFQVDPRDYIAARDQARGQLAAAEGQLNAARAALALARISYPARLQAAQAQRQAAEATLTRAQADLRRQQSVPRAATSQQEIDLALAGQRQAQAQVAEAEANIAQAQPVQENIAQVAAQVTQLEGTVAQARAQLAQAELNLSYCTVTAPQEGWVTKRNLERGNYVQPGTSLMSLVTPDVWVTANFKETQLNRMRPGQKVDISVDAYSSLKLHGHVDSIQLGSGAQFAAFPPENATGNFVKIVRRVPAKIVIDSGLDPNVPLPLGISVVPTVTLK